VYLKAYQDGKEARGSLGEYFRFYNIERPHQGPGYRTPAEVLASIPVEDTSEGVLQSLSPDPLRSAEPNLNIAPVLS
jgi:putative transposase